VQVEIDATARTATLTVHGPTGPQPKNGAEYAAAGCVAWALQCWRELDDALLQLRFDHEEVGLLVLKTRGDRAALLQVEKDLFGQPRRTGCATRSCCRWRARCAAST
jgi:benzoyl-CoA-dihydrodiol lyase